MVKQIHFLQENYRNTLAINKGYLLINIFILKLLYAYRFSRFNMFVPFRELFHEIVNQSLYTSHNITDFVHLWFCEKLDEKLAISSSLTFCENTECLARWEKWLARRFTKCYLHTFHFSHFADIFSHSRQFDDKRIAGLRIPF